LGYFVAFSSDGQLLALAQDRNRIELRNAATLQHLASLEMRGSATLSGLSLSPDGAWLAAAADFNSVIALWDLRRLREELAALHLDWEMAPYPPPGPAEPLRVEVIPARPP
jgi:WD40 repeat protein